MTPQSTGPETPATGPIVVLDDELIIAMHFADTLSDLGAQDVVPCCHAADVERLLEPGATAPRFAFLDFNLASGNTSEDLARALSARNIPFAFVTGFGTLPELDTALAHIRCLAKPVKGTKLAELLAQYNLLD